MSFSGAAVSAGHSNLLSYRCDFCKAQWCYGCGVPWPRNSEPPHALNCGNPNQELDPEPDDEGDEQDNLVDRSDPDFDNSEHDVTGAEQDPDGNIENGGPSGENRTQANPEAEQETDPILVQENQPPQVVQHSYSRLTPDQRNCLHRNAWFHRSGSSTCQICHWYAELFIMKCRDCDLSACRECTTTRRLRELRDSTPVEEVQLPWGGAAEAEILADDRWAEAGGAVAGPSRDPFGLGLRKADAQLQAADAEDNLHLAREHIAEVREQLAEAQKRLLRAEEGLELVSLDNEAAVRLLDRFKG